MATLEASDAEGGNGTAHQVPARNRDVDLLLEDRIRPSDHVEEVAEIVGDERVAGPLGEETKHAADERTAPHTGRLHHILPRDI